MKFIKSERGITLLSLIVYMILVAAALGILGAITNFMYGNTARIKSNSKYSSEFDRFNSNFLRDTQKYNHAHVYEEDGKIKCKLDTSADGTDENIIDQGVTYIYNPEKRTIVRRSQDGVELEVARNVYAASFKVNDPQKKKIGVSVHLEIGPSGSASEQDVYYVLKFW